MNNIDSMNNIDTTDMKTDNNSNNKKRDDIDKEMDELFVNRKGITINAFMKTEKLIGFFKPNINLKFKKGYIKPTIKSENLDIVIPNIPPHIYISGEIVAHCHKNKLVNKDNNILGKNQYLVINNKELSIPIAETTAENLSYYHCTLIKNKNIFKLEADHSVGYFKMSIGSEYLTNYLLRLGYGNGCYLEIHNQPHYYKFNGYNNKIDSLNNNRGYLIIGKKIGGYYVLSAFEVPDNDAIYIPPNVYHCDGCLVGKYNVIYSKTKNYNTLLLRNIDCSVVNIKFHNSNTYSEL